MRKSIPQLLFIFLLAGCTLPRFKPILKAVASPIPYSQCAWVWATQPQPELSAKVEAAIQAAGLKEVTFNAEVFGENCINAAKKVDHFAGIETDFHLTAKVANLTDKENLGNLLLKMLVVLDGLPADKIPGPQPGNISVSFRSDQAEANITFTITKGKSARALGYRGLALFEELQGK